jgi:hypothetical protein
MIATMNLAARNATIFRDVNATPWTRGAAT